MSVLVDVTLTDLQDDTEAVVERGLRQPGGRVGQSEPLLEVNTDKAVVEVPAPASGVLREVLKQANESIAPDEVLGRIEVGDDQALPGAPAVGQASGRETARG